ncbi:MAG: GNAT family N-acetyltransferase, partial [Candidatus Zixiibacteriota bacterium]
MTGSSNSSIIKQTGLTATDKDCNLSDQLIQEPRRLTIDDYDQIINLWLAAGLPFKPDGRDSRSMMREEMALTHCAFFGFFQGDSMLAVGIANYDGRRGWVNRVAVHPDHRGLGLAKQMIRACESFLMEQGAVVICALIEEENYPS